MAQKFPFKSRRKDIRLSAWQKAFVVLGILMFIIIGVGNHYREAITYFISGKVDKQKQEQLDAFRNFQVLSIHGDKSIGFDVSEYQGEINWLSADTIAKTFPLDFVFIRATAGRDAVDKKFAENWLGAKVNNLICGAYHYYRPNENSIEQAENFIKTVRLEKGDLPPVLDIEQLPEEQSIDSLKTGLRRWLNKVEKHYKVRPIIYSNESYYNDFLKDEFSGYTFWIANYSFFEEEIDESWQFWQFTENASIPGIAGDVDVNIFNGTREQLHKQTIGKIR